MNVSTVQSELETLAEQVRRAYPGARVEFEMIPSGMGRIDVFHDDRHYLMVYTPSYRLYSVDEVGADEPPFINYYRYNYSNFVPAAERFRKLVSGQEPPVHPEGSWRDAQS